MLVVPHLYGWMFGWRKMLHAIEARGAVDRDRRRYISLQKRMSTSNRVSEESEKHISTRLTILDEVG